MAATNTNAVHFFDLDSKLPGSSRPWSPNTIKTRMVLNFKRIPYTQSWISYPDIAPLLSKLSTPPARGGTPYTLPAIVHKASIKSTPSGVLMDSFAIACHLDQSFPSRPLFPSGDASYALTLAVNKLLSNLVAKFYTLLLPNIAHILDPRGREYFIKTRSARFGKPLSEVRPKNAEAIQAITEESKKEMEVLAQMLRGKLGKKGPFFEGDKPGYADLLVVSVLAWCERGDKDLWRALVNVGEGEVRALWDACLPWLEGQGEEKDWEISQ